MHVVTLKDFDGKWMEEVVDLGLDMKKNPEKYQDTLKQKTLCMLFQKTSTRTRMSFETGMTKLGGHAIFLDWRTSQFILADIKDEAKVLSRYADIIMFRPLKNKTLMEVVEGSEVPVINGLCEKYHPCQALADIMSIKEKKGKLKDVKVVYVGIGNNVSNSLSLACTKTGAKFTLCVPEKDPDSIDEEVLKQAQDSGLYNEEPDVDKAVKDADIIYTDTWVNMEFFLNEKFKEEKERREQTFMPYQLNKAVLEKAPNAFSMHDMPAHIGFEIDEYAARGPKSIMFDQAENRMWSQMALMYKLLKK